MKKNSLILALLVGGAFLYTSCSKEMDPDLPLVAIIDIDEPMANDTLAQGEELNIRGTITSLGDDRIHGYSISATNLTTGDAFMQYAVSGFFASDDFQMNWINDVMDTTVVRVKVDVELQEGGAHKIREVDVVCLP